MQFWWAEDFFPKHLNFLTVVYIGVCLNYISFKAFKKERFVKVWSYPAEPAESGPRLPALDAGRQQNLELHFHSGHWWWVSEDIQTVCILQTSCGLWKLKSANRNNQWILLIFTAHILNKIPKLLYYQYNAAFESYAYCLQLNYQYKHK